MGKRNPRIFLPKPAKPGIETRIWKRGRKRIGGTSDWLLEVCEMALDKGRALDTQIRDILAEGLARLLFAAYDCQAIALDVSDEAFDDFREKQVAEWFRSHGFVEWFCQDAAELFRRAGSPSTYGGTLRVRSSRRRKTAFYMAAQYHEAERSGTTKQDTAT